MNGRLAGPADADAWRVVERMCAIAVREPLEGCGALAARHLALTGTRLRSRLALDAARALGAPDDAALAWATCCELLVEAMMVHDDLQDGDLFRSGQPTVWARSGAAQAINLGDYLLLLAVAAVEDVPVEDAVRWRLGKALSSHGARAIRAQALEWAQSQGRRVGWDDWAQRAAAKSDVRFVLPVHGAVLLQGGSSGEARRQAAPFARLGVLHEIQRDVFDLFGEVRPRSHREGLHDGRITALVAQHLDAWPDDAGWLAATLQRGREGFDADALQSLADRFHEAGTLACVIERALADAEAIPSVQGPLRSLFQARLREVVEPLRALDESLVRSR